MDGEGAGDLPFPKPETFHFIRGLQLVKVEKLQIKHYQA